MAQSARAISTSSDILERFRLSFGREMDLAIRPAYLDLLEKLGNPHKKLPPVFHVAGTNGKGSTCAFLRSILEAAGYKVHVYTSPHLVHFHERIRVAGKLIGEAALTAILEECERLAAPDSISYFEVATAAAFAAFVRHPADFTILETGLGGRLDATNVVEKPLATIITRLSYDHRDFLGDTLTQIAKEKAGIMRAGVPCFAAKQPDGDAITALREAAVTVSAPLVENWNAELCADGFYFSDAARDFDLPLPALPGVHQIQNAGLAIAALSVLPKPVSRDAIIRGLQTVEWPARLQKITQGSLFKMLPQSWELWLDGGHNDSAGEALAEQAKAWKSVAEQPLLLVAGMLKTKRPEEFLKPLAPFVSSMAAIEIPGKDISHPPGVFASHAKAAGIANAIPCSSLRDAVEKMIRTSSQPARILICGSLYLAGHVLEENDRAGG